jgi:hypothetical protein
MFGQQTHSKLKLILKHEHYQKPFIYYARRFVYAYNVLL